MSGRRLLSLLFAFILGAAASWGQVNGRLTGSVTDPSGAAVAGASVDLYLPGGASAVLSTKTNSTGVFDFASVRPDVYTLKVSSPGFAVAEQQNVKVDPVRGTSLQPIELELASASQVLNVTESAATIDTASAEVSTTITQQQVQNLPVFDRQVNNLFYTQPGVNNNGNSDTVINGLRAQNTNVTLDGVNIQDNFIRINGLDYLPNKLTIGEVSEITVSSSNASPTIGGNANVVSLSTPSGTNQYHGNAYWYNRNNFFSANDWFNNQDGVARPFLNLNQFGGTFAGPVIKDKLLFFANYETYDLHQTSPQLDTILTPTARQGILQYQTGGSATRQFNVLNAQNLSIDPYIQTLLSKLPTVGNSSAVGDGLNTTGYQFNARSNIRRDSIVGKVDYNLSTSNVFSGTYRWNRDNDDRPDIGNFLTPVPPVSNRNGAHFFSGSWRWTPTSTLTNELRGGGNLAQAPFDVAGAPPPFFVSGTIFSDPVNTFLPQGRTTHTFNLQDNANWVHGKHTVSFGFQMQQIRTAVYDYAGIVPTYTLGFSTGSGYGFNVGDIPGASATDTDTANNLLQTLGGLITSATQNYNVTSRTSGFVPGAASRQDLSFNDYAGYVTDNWRVLSRLTLNLGLRWDYFPPVNEANSLLLQPELINNNPVETLLGNATLNFVGNSVGRPMYHKDLNNFAPTFGFAWDVFGNGKTAIRGGYSISYAQEDLLEAGLNTVGVNAGLVGTSNLYNVIATTSAPPPLTAPTFQVPITTEQNFLNTSGGNVQGLVDPHLRTPYVQQWNIGVEQEFKNTIFSAHYIGNHAVKLLRQIDFNQINIYNGGFLQNFINARNNGLDALKHTGTFDPSYNPAIPGSVNLPFFNSLPGGGYLTDPAVSPYILSGEVASLAQLYQTYGILPSDNFSFFPNPYSLYSSELTNLTNSSYDAIQLEARRRTSSGMQFQVSYVFGKALTNTSVERGLDALLNNNDPSIERARAPWDLNQAFKLNHYIPLPVGRGHRLSYDPLNKLLDGWAVSGFLTVQSGNPVSILSARGTLNRGARSGQNTVDTPDSLGQLKNISGLFMTGNGPYFINPANVDQATGQGVAPDGSAPFSGQVFFNPEAGTLGTLQRRLLSGPWYNNYNFAILKDTRLTERQSIQFRADFYNLFNHPNFLTGDQNVNNFNFGKITSMFYSAEGVGPRVIQFGLFYKF